MCGISGFVASSGINLPILYAVESLEKQLERGTQGCGIMFLHHNRVNVIKSPTHPFNFLNTIAPSYRNVESNVAIAHNRDPTSEVNIHNTHPFVNSFGMALVHNGVVPNDKEYRKILECFGIKFEGTCDTEVLVRFAELIMKFFGNNISPVNFYEKYVEIVKTLHPGVVILLVPQFSSVIFVRTHNPLYIQYSDDRKIMIFASTRKALKFLRKKIEQVNRAVKWNKIMELKINEYLIVNYNDEKLIFDEKKLEETTERNINISYVVPIAHRYKSSTSSSLYCPFNSRKKARKKCKYRNYTECPYLDKNNICPFNSEKKSKQTQTVKMEKPHTCRHTNPEQCYWYYNGICLWDSNICKYKKKKP